MKTKGFTLIELLVVIAIIGVLATIIISSIQSTRTRARDAAVTSVVSSFRTEAELVFNGTFTNLCTSTEYTEIENYITEQGGQIEECVDGVSSYRIIARLPSGGIAYSNFTAYAAGEDGVCVNSNGFGQRVFLDDANALNIPYCSVSEPGASLVSGGPIDGTCGPAHGGVYPGGFPPEGDLCSTGTPGDQTSYNSPELGQPGGYRWTCYGTGGGTDALCEATNA